MVTGKVIVVGSSNAGKTSLVNRFAKNTYAENAQATIVVDTCVRNVRVDDNLVELIMYDTAGQERFAGLTSQYFRQGDVCLLCVDLAEVANGVTEGGRKAEVETGGKTEDSPGTSAGNCAGAVERCEDEMLAPFKTILWWKEEVVDKNANVAFVLVHETTKAILSDQRLIGRHES